MSRKCWASPFTPCKLRGSSPRQSGRLVYRLARRAMPCGTTTHRYCWQSASRWCGGSRAAGSREREPRAYDIRHLMLASEDRTRRAIDAAWTADGLRSWIVGIWPGQRPVSSPWQVLDSNLSAGLSDQGQCPGNAFSLGISLLSIARCYSRVRNE
jgi:hypothetical protein